MSAKKLKAVTPITEYREERLSLNIIDVLPERFQTRAQTDPEVVHTYAQWIANGTDMGSVIVVHTADDRWILADGFHRHAAHVKLKLRSIKAQIREGTETDAILVGIEQNAALSKLRGLSDADRRHAAELMIRNEETRSWPDLEIGKRCSLNNSTVKNIRLDLRDRNQISLPERVILLSNGTPTGKTRRYSQKVDGIPAISRKKDGRYRTTLNGQNLNLGTDKNAASESLAEIMRRRDKMRRVLSRGCEFRAWLATREIRGRPFDDKFGGTDISGCLIVQIDEDSAETLLREVGRITILRHIAGREVRVIMVGYTGGTAGIAGRICTIAGTLSSPIEFMTPEELVAEFGPKDTGDPQP